ncbi:MAG: hypothetical protein QOD01_1959 [Actinomycetota bacterium]|nr:hypothetical protein [Actinomycetota bacterium]
MSADWPDGRRSVPPPVGIPAPGSTAGPPASPHSKRGAKAIVAALVLVLLIVFVIRNSQRVSVDFIVIQGHFRLIWVIVICSILGGVVGYLLGRPPKRTRHQRSDGDLPRE